jgi:hypothetical protein
MTVRELACDKARTARLLGTATYTGPERRAVSRDPTDDRLYRELRAMRRSLLTEIREDCRALRLANRS